MIEPGRILPMYGPLLGDRHGAETAGRESLTVDEMAARLLHELGVRRHLRYCDTSGLLPKGFAIWRLVFGPHRLAIPQRTRGVAIVPFSSTSVTLGP